MTRRLLCLWLCAALLAVGAAPALAAEEAPLSIRWVTLDDGVHATPGGDGYVDLRISAGRAVYHYGLMDAEGNLLAPVEAAYPVAREPLYTGSARDEDPDIHSFEGENGLYGYKNWRTGEIVLPPAYQAAGYIVSGGLANVELDGRKLVINMEGEIQFAHTYNWVGPFCEGLAVVEKDGLYGYVDAAGREVVPLSYLYGTDFSGGLAVVELDVAPYPVACGILKNPLLADTVSTWAAPEVEAARAAGLVTGRTGTYMTYGVTRLQFAELAANLVETVTGEALEPAAADRFADTDDLWVRKAAAAGIVNGTGDGTVYAPGRLITREELAVMLDRTLALLSTEQYGGPPIPERADLSAYEDRESVSPWAAQALSSLIRMGVLQGVSETALGPRNPTTVEQAVVMISRLYRLLSPA